MLLIALNVNSQTIIKDDGLTNLLTNLDLSRVRSSDTSFYYVINVANINSWLIENSWTNVIGTGTLSLEVSSHSNLTNFIAYNGSLSTTITGATGRGAWEDYIFAWKYVRLRY